MVFGRSLNCAADKPAKRVWSSMMSSTRTIDALQRELVADVQRRRADGEVDARCCLASAVLL